MLTIVQANIKLEAYGYAIADATKAIELDESYVKVSNILCTLRIISALEKTV